MIHRLSGTDFAKNIFSKLDIVHTVSRIHAFSTRDASFSLQSKG